MDTSIVVVSNFDHSVPHCTVTAGAARADIETDFGSCTTCHIGSTPIVRSGRSYLDPIRALFDMGGPRTVRNCRIELPVDCSILAVIILVQFHQPEIECLGTGRLTPYSGRIDHTLHLNNPHVLGVGLTVHGHGETNLSGTGIVRKIVISGKRVAESEASCIYWN